jgi:hypothetical protein
MGARIIKALRSPEGIIWLCSLFFVVSCAYLLAAYTDTSNVSAAKLFIHYSGLTREAMTQGIAFFFLVYTAAILFRAILFLYRANYRDRIDPRTFLTLPYARGLTRSFGRELASLLKTAIPLIFFLFTVFFMVATISTVFRSELADDTLHRWDQRLFGMSAFLTLATIPYPSWLASYIVFSYSYLVVAVLFAALYLFYVNRRVFREFAGAFALGVIIMFPGWFFLPAIAPQGRFIDNNYALPIDDHTRNELERYRPHPQVANFLQTIRELNAPLDNLPVSTFPSAHIAWAVLAAYYLYRARQYIVFAGLLPLFFFSSVGTVLLAEHYLVDIPAGVLATVLTIYLARRILVLQPETPADS